MMNLLFRSSEPNEESAFERRALQIAHNSKICVACPYVSLEFLRDRLFKISRCWRFITDIPECVATTRKSERNHLLDFFDTHHYRIRHQERMHAKVLVGETAALFGSANFSIAGMRLRNEVGAHVDDAEALEQLRDWFDLTWNESSPIDLHLLKKIVSDIPDRNDGNSPSYIANALPKSLPVDLSAYPAIRYFSGVGFSARGYHEGNGTGFWVLEGSRFKSSTNPSFEENQGYVTKRNEIIKSNLLDDWILTKDVYFTASSQAASVVSGSYRSGNKEWR